MKLTMQNGRVVEDRDCDHCGGPLGDSYIRDGGAIYCGYDCYDAHTP